MQTRDIAPLNLPLVGRESELQLLSSLLADAEHGSGRTVFISGEAGVGKTRVVSTAAERAKKHGWHVALGRAYAVETGIPYALFSDALLPLFRGIEPSALTVLTRGAASELGYLFPALGSTNSRRMESGDPSELKARMLWTFSQFLGRLAGRAPLCVVFDNLQWADASSLELFHFLARQIDKSRIALVATYNSADVTSGSLLAATEASLVKSGAAWQHRVAPLTTDDVGELIQRTFNVDPESIPHFVGLLFGWTRGNPFFIEETLKSLVASGTLRQQNGTWTGWDVETLALPTSVRDAVTSRLSLLGPGARELVDLMAVMGTRATFPQLLSISGLEEAELVERVETLRAMRVVEEIPGQHSEASYDFSHPVLQQVTYEAIGTARARMMHACIGDQLERHYGARARDHAGELAFHFSRAHSARGKAVQYLSTAGIDALQHYSNREAATYLSSALEQIDSADGTARDEIVRGLARARQRLGDYDGALTLWSVARESARAAGDMSALAAIEHRAGLAQYWSARFEQALETFANALEAAQQSGDVSLVVRLHLARAVSFQDLARLAEARKELDLAHSAALSSNDDSLLARTHRALLLSYAWTGPARVAHEHGQNAVLFAERSGQKMLEWTAHWGMALFTGLTGDAQQLLYHLAECDRLADDVHSPVLPLWSAEIRVQYASSVGDWDAALALGERSMQLAESLGQRTLLPRLAVWTGLIHLWRGESERASELLNRAWKLSGAETQSARVELTTVVPAYIGMATYHLETDNFGEAIRVGEKALSIADRAGFLAWSLQWVLPVVGEAALWMSDFDRAERHLHRMRRDAERFGTRYGDALANACEGMLVLFRGDPVRAIPLLTDAIRDLEGIGYRNAAARVRRVLAIAYKHTGDKEAAISEFRRAHDIFAEHKAAGELRYVREELRKLGARPPSRTIARGAGPLSAREAEIARMVAQRMSNKEIGAALDISARTVSTHLSNIFTKLGVTSRGELADLVRESGVP